MKTRLAIASIAIVGVAAVGFGGIYAAAASGNDKDAVEHIAGGYGGDPSTTPGTAFAVGPVTGEATVKALSDSRDEFQFADGTLDIDHTPKHENDQFDPKTCTATIDDVGTWKLVSGTGAYAHAEGHGTYSTHGRAEGACDQNTPPKVFAVAISAQGEMSV